MRTYVVEWSFGGPALLARYTVWRDGVVVHHHARENHDPGTAAGRRRAISEWSHEGHENQLTWWVIFFFAVLVNFVVFRRRTRRPSRTDKHRSIGEPLGGDGARHMVGGPLVFTWATLARGLKDDVSHANRSNPPCREVVLRSRHSLLSATWWCQADCRRTRCITTADATSSGANRAWVAAGVERGTFAPADATAVQAQRPNTQGTCCGGP